LHAQPFHRPQDSLAFNFSRSGWASPTVFMTSKGRWCW